MKKHDEWLYAFWWGYNSGIAVLDPTAEGYEDEFAEGYVQCIAFDGEEQTKVTHHNIKYAKPNWAKEEEPYFTKYGKRYYLNEGQRCF